MFATLQAPGVRRVCALAALAAVAMSTTALAQDTKCKLQKVVEWQVRSIGRHMAVDGAINGKRIGIVLDTGAPRSLLLRASAKRLDLPIHEVRGARVRGVGGDRGSTSPSSTSSGWARRPWAA